MTANISLYRKAIVAAIFVAIAVVLMVASPAVAQRESAILQLTASMGQDPVGGVIADHAGNLYGTTGLGGPRGYGTVFKLSPPASPGGEWIQTLLHSFSGAPDGNFPVGPLVLDKAGNLYGTATNGGLGAPYNYGVVFELLRPVEAGDPWTEKILYTFQALPDGQFPYGGLLIDSAGNLYGTTNYGGECATGTAFEVSPPSTFGSPWTERVIYSFRCTEFAGPGPLVMGIDGALYGVAGGGEMQDGTVFNLTPPAIGRTAWTEKILYTFTGEGDGSDPGGGLVARNGNLYGVAGFGASSACFYGLPGCGTIFELSPPTVAGGAWTETTIYSFTGGTDGANPEWSVLFDKEGHLYAVARGGGNPGCAFSSGCGAVIKLAPPSAVGDPWTENTLYDFTGRGDGGGSNSALVIGKFDRLYGTTIMGGRATCTYWGLSGCGVVFNIIP